MMSIDTAEIRELYRAVLSLRTEDECSAFFQDLCTIKELTDMGQRLRVARMLTEGHNYVDITGATGVSTATISRVNKCLNYGDGGYRTVLERTGDQDDK